MESADLSLRTDGATPSLLEKHPAPKTGVWPILLWLTLVAAGLLLIVRTAPPNFTQHNEDRIAGYVQDAVDQGHWMCQRDGAGNITSKPPLYTWIASAATLWAGRITPATLYFPSVLATFAAAWLIFGFGRKVFGSNAAFLAAVVFLLSEVADEQMAMARFDGLFSACIIAGAWAAFRAWNSGRGWVWFWLAASAATLTKGPLGIVLAGAGLLAAFWEKRSGAPAAMRGSHWPGVALFMAITLGWFALAYREAGQALIDKMLVQELVVQSVSDHGDIPLVSFYKPFVYFLGEFAPWSLFALFGFWRTIRQPAADPVERRCERFLFCWFAAGLVLFSLAAHQRSRLIYPLIPPAALMGGRELARWLASRSIRTIWKPVIALSVFGLFVIATAHQLIDPRTRHVKRTAGLRQLAALVEREGGKEFPLTHVDSPFAFQYFLGTQRPSTTAKLAETLLPQKNAAFIAVQDADTLQGRFQTLARWPETGRPVLQIVSNRPALRREAQTALFWQRFEIILDRARLEHSRGASLNFVAEAPDANVTIRNCGDSPDELEAHFAGSPDTTRRKRKLGPGEIWQFRPPQQ